MKSHYHIIKHIIACGCWYVMHALLSQLQLSYLLKGFLYFQHFTQHLPE